MKPKEFLDLLANDFIIDAQEGSTDDGMYYHLCSTDNNITLTVHFKEYQPEHTMEE